MSNFLYRYRTVDDYALDGIEKNEFYFASPSSFNDPFDCKTLFTLKDNSIKDWCLLFDKHLLLFEPQLSPEERRIKVEEKIQIENYKSPDVRKEQLRIWEKILEKESNKLGIVCLSKTPKDILMWSHYSDKHRGFCLKFDKKIIENKYFCHEMGYNPTYPTFKDYVKVLVQSKRGNYKSALLTKSKHWKYEKEFRLIEDPNSRPDSPGERKYRYPEEALVGIIWGCQMLKRNKKMIEYILSKRKHPLSVFKAIKDEDQYALKIKQISK